MALVPFRVSGAAADQRADERLFQFPSASVALRIRQRPAASGAAAPPAAALDGGGSRAGRDQHGESVSRAPPLDSLANVGLVVWQAGFLLADYLLRAAPLGDPRLAARLRLPRACSRTDPWVGGPGAADADAGASCGSWHHVTAVDLGTGTGLVGVALALAGARVALTDLPHVVPLAAENLADNCEPSVTRAAVAAYAWGDDPAASQPPALTMGWEASAAQAAAGGDAGASGRGEGEGERTSPLVGLVPDLITAADVLYHEDLIAPLMCAVQILSAPHTVTYISYRVRHGREVSALAAVAEGAGFAVEAVPRWQLHEEYQGGDAAIGAGHEEGEGGSEDEGTDGQGGGGMGLLEGSRASGSRTGEYGILRLCRREPAAGLAEGGEAQPRLGS